MKDMRGQSINCEIVYIFTPIPEILHPEIKSSFGHRGNNKFYSTANKF